MVISDLKQLRDLIALCKKQGVLRITVDNIEMEISPMVAKTRTTKVMADIPEASIKVPKFNPITKEIIADADVESFDELTDEQKLFYSARPEVPGDQ
jgi:hypothetical protein